MSIYSVLNFVKYQIFDAKLTLISFSIMALVMLLSSLWTSLYSLENFKLMLNFENIIIDD